MALTELACKNGRCPADRPRLRQADSAGLYLEVTPAGGGYWRWKCRHAGKEKRLALGAYPEVGLAAAAASAKTPAAPWPTAPTPAWRGSRPRNCSACNRAPPQNRWQGPGSHAERGHAWSGTPTT